MSNTFENFMSKLVDGFSSSYLLSVLHPASNHTDFSQNLFDPQDSLLKPTHFLEPKVTRIARIQIV